MSYSKRRGHGRVVGDDFEVGDTMGTGSYGNTGSGPYKDKAWAIAFVANVCIAVFTAVYYRNTKFSAEGHLRRLLPQNTEVDNLAALQKLVVFEVMALVTWALTSGTLHLLTIRPKRVLQVAYLSFIATLAVTAAVALHLGLSLTAAASGAACAVFLLYFVKRQSRIRFGAANLKVAALAVKATPGIIRYPLFMGFIQVVWSMTAAAAARGSIAAFRTVVAPDGTSYPAAVCQNFFNFGGRMASCECNGQEVSANSACEYKNSMFWFLACFWLASAAWGFAVAHNAVVATVAGSVASWWFSPGDALAVRGAFFRATRGSFGSLCKAAAVTAVLRVVMFPARRMCFVRRCMASVQYGLSYVICFISIYGLSFSEGLGRVNELFKRRGLTVITNDTVVSIGLHFLGLGLTLSYFAALLLTWVTFMDFMNFRSPTGMEGLIWILSTIVPFVVVPAMLVFWTMVKVVRSSLKVVFVCFVQDPHALQANHNREIFNDLSHAWQQMQMDSPGLVSSEWSQAASVATSSHELGTKSSDVAGVHQV